MPKVTIYTQAYNPGAYLEQCAESVLNQTYGDFEWLLIDHGSTDNTREAIQRYAERDKRIVPVYIDVNGSVPDLFFGTVRRHGTGKYLTHLDSDDWWDLDFLERLVSFAEENDLDLAMTGAVQFFEKQGISRVMRKLDAPAVMTRREFAREFPEVGPFAGALWGTLKVTEKFLPLETEPNQIAIGEKRLNWRSDTLIMLSYVDHCRRIGVNDLASYHYRIHSSTLSRAYSDSYFESNLYFYQRMEDFFRRHDVWEDLKGYLDGRYFHEMLSTLDVLKNAPLSSDEKLRVCARVVAHPLTRQVLPHDCREKTDWLVWMRKIAREALLGGQLTDLDALGAVLELLAPDCAHVVTPEGLPLFARQEELTALLLRNERAALAQRLLDLLGAEERPEDPGLASMLRNLLPEGSPLERADSAFLRDYREIARLALNGGYLVALDQMTELLMEKTPLKGEETFLQLYLTLAALENQPAAFLFGKLRLAELCRREGRTEESRALLAELEDMGAGALPEAAALRAALNGEAPV